MTSDRHFGSIKLHHCRIIQQTLLQLILLWTRPHASEPWRDSSVGLRQQNDQKTQWAKILIFFDRSDHTSLLRKENQDRNIFLLIWFLAILNDPRNPKQKEILRFQRYIFEIPNLNINITFRKIQSILLFWPNKSIQTM